MIKLSVALLVPDAIYCSMAEKWVLSSPLCVAGSWRFRKAPITWMPFNAVPGGLDPTLTH